MIKLEEVKEQYRCFEARNKFLKTLEDLSFMLDIKIDDLEEMLPIIRKTITANKRDKVGDSIRNIFALFLGLSDLEYYDEDNKLLEQANDLTLKWIEYYRILKNASDEVQVPELIRLMDFTSDYYDKNYDYLESRRKSLEFASLGIMSFH